MELKLFFGHSGRSESAKIDQNQTEIHFDEIDNDSNWKIEQNRN